MGIRTPQRGPILDRFTAISADFNDDFRGPRSSGGCDSGTVKVTGRSTRSKRWCFSAPFGQHRRGDYLRAEMIAEASPVKRPPVSGSSIRTDCCARATRPDPEQKCMRGWKVCRGLGGIERDHRPHRALQLPAELLQSRSAGWREKLSVPLFSAIEPDGSGEATPEDLIQWTEGRAW